MREIKFRAWKTRDREEGFMDYEPWLCHELGSLSGSDSSDVLMQYTGLKNKHGVEIYEGDIVRVEGTELRTVVYEWASFHLVSSSGSRILFEDTNLETLELVGNIHMHPGLLEKMQKLESESV